MEPEKTVETLERTTTAKTLPEQEPAFVAVSSGGAATLNTWRNIRLIIGREYKYRVTQRSFVIMSVILLVIVVIAAFIPTIVQLLASGSNPQTHIVVVNNAGTVAGMDEASLIAYINSELNGTSSSSKAPFVITSEPSANLNDLQNQVKNGKLDILLVLDRETNQNIRFTYNTNASAANDSNLSTIRALTQLLTFLDTAHRLGLTPQETKALAASPDLIVVHPQQSQDTRPQSESTASYILATAGVILIFISVEIYGGIVATGVAEEKSSRMMEILVNVATPFQLLAGKILGIGAACLTQMGCLVVVGIGALLLQIPLQAALFGASAGGLIQYLIAVSIPFYVLFLIYFLQAFFLYATLFAGLASLVKRQEEVQSVIMLPLLLLATGYVLFFFTVATPDATSTKVLSYIPFWTPIFMLMRTAVGTVFWWEIVVTIVLMLVTILACTWFSARLYRYGVLMYGQRPSLSQIMQLVRSN